MREILAAFFSSSFMPQGQCYQWDKNLLLLHVLSDTLICLSYYSIPVALLLIVRRRADLAYNWLVLLFASFIFMCGTTHLMEIWTVWYGSYWMQGLVKLTTGVVSLACALVLWPLVPKILALPSADDLKEEISRRQRLHDELRQTHVSELGRAHLELQRLAAIVDSSQDAIIGLQLDGTVFEWNQAAIDLFGFRDEEVVGRSIATISPGAGEELWKELRHLISTGSSVKQVELQCERRDGRQVAVWLTVSPLYDGQGGSAGLSVIARDVTDRKMAERSLTQSLRDKELLLKEIHHRVKNNLQVICSLLRLQSNYLEPGPSKVMFQESEERVRAMALVHDKFYRTESLARVNFKNYVDELAHQLLRTYTVGESKIKLELAVKDTEFTIEKAIPCGLILNELIANALKYAFRGRTQGLLRISMTRAENRITLKVADDGVGLPASVDFDNPTTLGLRVVKTLGEQLDAELSLGRQGGTEFVISFDVNNQLQPSGGAPYEQRQSAGMRG